MALKIRLRQQGRNNRPFYRLVVADVRSPRDGKYLESLGWYNPLESTAERLFSANAERLQHWISMGAEVSENVQALLKKSQPAVLKAATQKEVAKKAKALQKRKARAKKAG